MTYTSPLVNPYDRLVPAAATAVDSKTDVVAAPFAATVTNVNYVPIAAIVGADTNTRTVQLVNKGAAGAGTTVVASKTFNAASGTTPADEVSAVTLSAVAGATTVAQGDVLEWQSNHVGTGLADPGGLAHIELTRS